MLCTRICVYDAAVVGYNANGALLLCKRFFVSDLHTYGFVYEQPSVHLTKESSLS